MSRTSIFSLLIAAVISPSALAHSNSTSSVMSGFLHVFTGFDHLISMIAVGLWLACLSKPTQKAILTATPIILCAGILIGIGFDGINYNSVAIADSGIAFALILDGVLIASQTTTVKNSGTKLTVMAFVGVFLALHGIAHTEAFGVSPISFTAGLLLSSALLQIAGLLLGNWLARQQPTTWKVTGALVSVIGMSLVGIRVISG